MLPGDMNPGRCSGLSYTAFLTNGEGKVALNGFVHANSHTIIRRLQRTLSLNSQHLTLN